MRIEIRVPLQGGYNTQTKSHNVAWASYSVTSEAFTATGKERNVSLEERLRTFKQDENGYVPVSVKAADKGLNVVLPVVAQLCSRFTISDTHPVLVRLAP